MTDFHGVNATKLLVNVPSDKAAVGERNGRKRYIYDSFTFDAIIDTTDRLLVGAKIPAGARVTDVKLQHPDMGTTGDFNIGWLASDDGVEVADADGFGAAVDVNAAAGSYSMFEDQPQAGGMYKKFTREVQPLIVPSEITTATSGTIDIEIEYVVD